LQPGSDGVFPEDLPPVIQDTITRLDQMVQASLDEREKIRATRALGHLYRLLQNSEALIGKAQ
jgi:hypothetical protein